VNGWHDVVLAEAEGVPSVVTVVATLAAAIIGAVATPLVMFLLKKRKMDKAAETKEQVRLYRQYKRIADDQAGQIKELFTEVKTLHEAHADCLVQNESLRGEVRIIRNENNKLQDQVKTIRTELNQMGPTGPVNG
jgi:phosphomevalonate kinase